MEEKAKSRLEEEKTVTENWSGPSHSPQVWPSNEDQGALAEDFRETGFEEEMGRLWILF